MIGVHWWDLFGDTYYLGQRGHDEIVVWMFAMVGWYGNGAGDGKEEEEAGFDVGLVLIHIGVAGHTWEWMYKRSMGYLPCGGRGGSAGSIILTSISVGNDAASLKGVLSDLL